MLENTLRGLGALVLTLACTQVCYAKAFISAAEAKDHINESATVCGQVVSTHFASTSRGSPTFLNLDKPYPHQIFAVVIWGENRSKFGTPEESYANKKICVAGEISQYKGIPEIVVADPYQINILDSNKKAS